MKTSKVKCSLIIMAAIAAATAFSGCSKSDEDSNTGKPANGATAPNSPASGSNRGASGPVAPAAAPAPQGATDPSKAP